ncbi:MAG: phosphoheptose isomerase [Chloroflexi bacterium RBG_16_68_14]|nr:MAG: phosphoheptose isomerase [Chloroflexi bacterium RBG_16_68_14]
MNRHLRDLPDRFPALAACASDIERAFLLLRDCYAGGCKALVCGNGGSAADAEHWAGELLKSFVKKRPLSADVRQGLSAKVAEGLQDALPMIPLTGFLSFRTAFANDADPDLVFAQLVWALGRPGDVLLALSTSGDSANICLAAEAASGRGMRTIALTGETGGDLAELANVCVRAPARQTHLVQEFHVPVYHCLSLMLEDEFFA